MTPRFFPRPLAAAAICLSLLAGCASLPRGELQTLGSEVVREKVDFQTLDAGAKRAKAAYSSPAAIRAAYPKTVRVATPGGRDVQYFIERDDKAKVQYITVRGTTDDTTLKEDFDTKVRSDRATKIPVHSGFDLDARAVWTDAQPYLKSGYQTYVVGHSLGGAVAAILGIYMIEDGYKVDKIYTYGQPRFTTADGVKQLGFLPLLRVVDENDLVPVLPPGMMGNKKYGRYEQVGPEIILLEGPDYVYLPGAVAAELSYGEFWRDLHVADLKDHKLDNYIRRIEDKFAASRQVAYNSRETYVAKKKVVASLQPGQR
ncbi:MAG: lipase family protein [Aestuariivirga sp.]|uniref:lipase family protein n=1 Tax=Aestuariivirga sp. TaxID=2650926 RepID=UPI0025C2253E|nr:lipase family protein [Aestuariivirga sp.]MCA3561888.1 lipase family protein [Aestuariivirga sp.]